MGDLQRPCADQPAIAWFEGGRSWAGTRAPVIPADGEGVVRPATLRPFGMEAHAVSVARFAAFVSATGYVTDAERIGWSYVFRGLAARPERLEIVGAAARTEWWWALVGACRHLPPGPTEAPAHPDPPATQISFNDARRFADWAGGRLPREVEWEHAA